MVLAEKLEKLRKEKKMSKQQLANELGLGVTTIKNYENKKNPRIPNTDIIKKISKYYNVSYEYLLNDECENKTSEKIDIGKSLKLSDLSIQKIKDLQHIQSTFYKNLQHIQSTFYIEEFSPNEENNEENTVSPNAFNFFIENFNDLERFTFLFHELMCLTNMFNELNTFTYISSMQFYIADCLLNEKALDELFEILDNKFDSIHSYCSEYLSSFVLIVEDMEELESCKEELKEYCTSFFESLAEVDTPISRDDILHDIHDTLKEISEISQSWQYGIESDIKLTKYELSKLFSNFFDSFKIDIFKDNEIPKEFIKLKKVKENQKKLNK